MGRWAQAQRRGGDGPGLPSLGPPPAPVLSVDHGEVMQTAQGADDTGGQIVLESSDYPEGIYFVEDTDGWAVEQDWGAKDSYPGKYLRAKEVGNGSAYVGSSPYSNILIPD